MVEFHDVSFSYPGKKLLEGCSLSYKGGGSYALLGPSGCGKTTLLKLAAGLLKADHGEVRAPARVSFMFQEPRLIPQKTLWKNLELPLNPFWAQHERARRIQEMLESLELIGYENRFPYQLSGGMQQRASMGRAFLYPSELLLMDEPFKGLDPLLRYKMIALLKAQLEIHRRTLISVTHQVDEALFLASDITCYGPGMKREMHWNNLLSEHERQWDNRAFLDQEEKILHWMIRDRNK